MNDNINWGTKINVFEKGGCHIVIANFIYHDQSTDMYWVSSEGRDLAYDAAKYNVVKFGDPKPVSVTEGGDLPLRLVGRKDMKVGDVFLWRSVSGRYEIHGFHSDAGYGVKTFTHFNEKDGSSTVVNWSGVCGVLETANEEAIEEAIEEVT